MLDRLDRARWIDEAETRLIEHEVMNVGRESRAAQRAAAAVGMTPERDRPTGSSGHGVDDPGHVLELPLDRVAGGITALPEASAIHRKRGHIVSQLVHQGAGAGVILQ